MTLREPLRSCGKPDFLPMANQENNQHRLDEDFRRSYNHENKNKPSSERPLEFKKTQPPNPSKDNKK